MSHGYMSSKFRIWFNSQVNETRYVPDKHIDHSITTDRRRVRIFSSATENQIDIRTSKIFRREKTLFIRVWGGWTHQKLIPYHGNNVFFFFKTPSWSFGFSSLFQPPQFANGRIDSVYWLLIDSPSPCLIKKDKKYSNIFILTGTYFFPDSYLCPSFAKNKLEQICIHNPICSVFDLYPRYNESGISDYILPLNRERNLICTFL